MRLQLVACVAAAASAWPDYVLHHECEKGLELLASNADFIPPIMGAIPLLDLGILGVAAAGQVVEPGAEVPLGTPLTISHNATAGTYGMYHLVFVVSSGRLEGGEPCGETGAELVCTTCGEDPGFLKRATWTPAVRGPARIAVGAARMLVGTPAVTIASAYFTVT